MVAENTSGNLRNHTVSTEPTARSSLKLFVLLVCFSAAILLLEYASKFFGNEPLGLWDDAYMFARYADNLLVHGSIAWNPGGPPTYGLTSPLFLLVVVPIRLLTPGNPVPTLLLSCFLCALLFLLPLPFLLWNALNTDSIRAKQYVLLFVLYGIAGGSRWLTEHFISGMDTCFALAYLTGYLLLSERQNRDPVQSRAITLGIYGGLAYFVRPDLLLYTLLIPVVWIVFGGKPGARRAGFITLGLLMVASGLELGFAALYFHSPIPLSVYAKVLGLYPDMNMQVYVKAPGEQLFFYIKSYLPLFFVIAMDIGLNFRTWKRESSPFEKGLLITTVLFLLYYRFCVVQIMFFVNRFYYPTLPVIALLAAHSALRLSRKWKDGVRPWLWRSGLVCGALIFAVTLLPRLGEIPGELRALAAFHLRPMTLARIYRERWETMWCYLDAFSRQPSDLVMATTEVGLPGAMNPEKTILDLAGLNETMLATHRFSAETFFARYHPDVIYMPHPDYRDMVRQIRHDPTFQRDYAYYPMAKHHGMLDIALRRDSKYFADMSHLLAK